MDSFNYSTQRAVAAISRFSNSELAHPLILHPSLIIRIVFIDLNRSGTVLVYSTLLAYALEPTFPSMASVSSLHYFLLHPTLARQLSREAIYKTVLTQSRSLALIPSTTTKTTFPTVKVHPPLPLHQDLVLHHFSLTRAALFRLDP